MLGSGTEQNTGQTLSLSRPLSSGSLRLPRRTDSGAASTRVLSAPMERVGAGRRSSRGTYSSVKHQRQLPAESEVWVKIRKMGKS